VQALANYLQEHNNQIEAELIDLRNRATANEHNSEARRDRIECFFFSSRLFHRFFA
jgi:hypothetical protein